MNSILLDTSFCIRLLKKDDPFHANTVEYFEYFLSNKIEMYLSTIVVSEYSVKDDPNNLPLKTMKLITFDFFDAKKSGEFYNSLIENRKEKIKSDRIVVINDCKLIAQIANRNIEGYITKDKKSFDEILTPLQQNFSLQFQTLDLTIPLSQTKNEIPFPH